MFQGGYDFQDNDGQELNVDWNNTDYSAQAHGNRVVNVINQHDQEKVSKCTSYNIMHC